MKNNPNKLWIIVFALGWFFDFLFWNKAPGVNFAIFAMACLTAAFYLLLSDGLRPNRTSLGLLPLFGFFAAVTFIRAEPLTTFLAYTFTMFTLTIFTVTYLGGRWIQYTLADYVSRLFALVGSIFIRPITFTADDRPANAFDGDPRTAWRAASLAPMFAALAELDSSLDERDRAVVESYLRGATAAMRALM